MAHLRALKFLGHWVGDIHQPLHVSFRDDLGGNEILEAGPCTGHLHRVWDSCILRRGLGTDVEAIARALLDDMDTLLADIPGDKQDWITSAPIDWAEESFQVATDPAVDYCVQKSGGCWYASDNKSWREPEDQGRVKVNQAYLDAHLDTVKRRLLLGGIRLGALLNDALAD